MILINIYMVLFLVDAVTPPDRHIRDIDNNNEMPFEPGQQENLMDSDSQQEFDSGIFNPANPVVLAGTFQRVEELLSQQLNHDHLSHAYFRGFGKEKVGNI
jgi:hypothetical protein